MPCTAKKFESRRSELKVSGLYPVDYVLTTREFGFLLKKNSIDVAIYSLSLMGTNYIDFLKEAYRVLKPKYEF